ncbi:MAG: ATP-binding protein [Solirubrobacteraceae bacterium]
MASAATAGALIGRETERSRLHAAATEAGQGRGSLVLLAGEAGIGKTVLARTALRASGLTVLEGTAIQDGSPAYWPLTSALRTPVPPSPDRAALLDAIAAALADAGDGGPVAVFLDDLQWADDGTLDSLVAMAPIIETEPVLLVGAYRSDEMPRGHPLRRLRSELRRQGRLHEIAVEPLAERDTAALLAKALGTDAAPSLVAAVLARTGGVPFFIEELAAALASSERIRSGQGGLELADADALPLPDSVRDAVLVRAAHVGANARAALTVAAAVGQSFDIELAAELASLHEWPEESVHQGFVVEVEPGRLRFRHDLVREAFYAEIPWSKRPALHRAIAEQLEDDGAAAAAVAEHWARGREPDRARRSFLAAAGEFNAVHAYRDAARSIRRALALWPEGADDDGRLDALDDLGRCAEHDGDLTGAVQAWREAADGRRAHDEPARLANTLRCLAGALELQGQWEDALAAREQAAESFASAARPADAAGERLLVATHLRSAASFHAALAVLKTAKSEAERSARPDLEARALGLEGNVRARMGEERRSLRLVRAGLALALEHNQAGAAAEIYQRLGDSLEHLGDYAAARRTYDDAFGYCTANALDPTAQICLACLSVVLRQTGDWDQSAGLCREVLASPACTLHARGAASGTLGLILAVRGQSRAARPLLLESATVARHIELAAMELLSGWGLAVFELASDQAAGVARCQTILERWSQTEERHYVISPLRWATTVFAQAGEYTDVKACTAALTEVAAQTGQVEAMSALAHALGEAALIDGDPEEAASHFERAASLLTDLGAPFERAQSHRRAAAALVAAGRREHAVEQLVTAHRAARRLRARPLTAEIADELAALGERLDRRLGRRAAHQSDHAGLTRRELEVVRLVALGQTDKEIARELFLSPRTVETHVLNIRSKLDCRSRADAARRANELGLTAAPAG